MKLSAIVFLWGIVAQAQIKWGVEAKAGITSGGLYGVSSPEWVMESASGLQIGGLLSAQNRDWYMPPKILNTSTITAEAVTNLMVTICVGKFLIIIIWKFRSM